MENNREPLYEVDAGAGASGPPPASAAPDPAGTPAAATPPAAGGADDNPFKFPQTDTPAAGTDAPDKPQAEGSTDIPDTYSFNLPEGLVLNDELQKQFTEIAHEAKLTQPQADKLIEMHCRQMMAVQRQAEEMKNTWVNECAKQGLTKPEGLRAAKLAVDTFGGGECMQALVESGVAYNPAVQKFLQNIGSLLQEDNAPDGKSAGGKSNAEDLLFPNSKY